MMKGSESLRVGHYPLGDGELQKGLYKEVNWSDLHFRNNMLMVCIKEKRERQQEFESHCSRPLGKVKGLGLERKGLIW